MKKWIFLTLSLYACSCHSINENELQHPISTHPIKTVKNPDPSLVYFKEEGAIPILCYHQLRDYKPTDGKVARDYIVPPAVFEAQMKALSDSGYHSVSPDALVDYLTKNAPLPTKPVMITFDDTDLEQYTVGAPILDQYQFKGVFFIMTVSIGRPHYMTKEQIRALSDAGHTIGSHTWDHHNVKKYTAEDWVTQVEKPTQLLQSITGKKVDYFAFPFGLWNEEAIPNLKQRGFKAAFQLFSKNSTVDSLYTIKRAIITGDMGTKGLFKRIHQAF